MAFVSVKDVYKRYKMGEITINASDGISFDIEKGELAIVLGPSGSGKTTVLNMLGGMDIPTEGKVIVDGKEISSYNDKQLSERLSDYHENDIADTFEVLDRYEIKRLYRAIGAERFSDIFA